MSACLKRKAPLLEFCTSHTPKRKDILPHGSPDFLQALCEVALNLLKGNIRSLLVSTKPLKEKEKSSDCWPIKKTSNSDETVEQFHSTLAVLSLCSFWEKYFRGLRKIAAPKMPRMYLVSPHQLNRLTRSESSSIRQTAKDDLDAKMRAVLNEPRLSQYEKMKSSVAKISCFDQARSKGQASSNSDAAS